MVYTHTGGSPVILSIGLNNLIGDSPKNLFGVYIPSVNSNQSMSKGLHTLCWLGSWKCLGLYTWWFNKQQKIIYIPMGGYTANNALVCAQFVDLSKTKL